MLKSLLLWFKHVLFSPTKSGLPLTYCNSPFSLEKTGDQMEQGKNF